MSNPREPILNVPGVVVVLLAVFALVHVLRVYVLSDDADRILIYTFAFVPARYDASVLADGVLPGGVAAGLWSFVTYAFLHADITHIGFNAVWFVAFASPVSRRFGTQRFLAFFVVTVAAGALAHLITHSGDVAPMIGASAAISGMMGAATRFVFQHGGSLDMWRGIFGDPDRIPAPSLRVALRNPRVLAFVVVWFGLNLVFGLGSISITGDSGAQTVAWEAHVGGFLAGLLLFSLFDPVGPAIGDNEIPDENSPVNGQEP